MSAMRIEAGAEKSVDVWASPLGVAVEIIDDGHTACAFLTIEKTDELIRALAAARVEISKASPR